GIAERVVARGHHELDLDGPVLLPGAAEAGQGLLVVLQGPRQIGAGLADQAAQPERAASQRVIAALARDVVEDREPAQRVRPAVRVFRGPDQVQGGPGGEGTPAPLQALPGPTEPLRSPPEVLLAIEGASLAERPVAFDERRAPDGPRRRVRRLERRHRL